jgi:hypothetical protein
MMVEMNDIFDSGKWTQLNDGTYISRDYRNKVWRHKGGLGSEWRMVLEQK